MVEAGLIVAGTYLSQYDVRAAASTTVNAYTNSQKNQYLIYGGLSPNQDEITAKNVKISATPYLGTNQNNYLSWVKAQVKLGAAVTIGVVLYGGDPNNEYEHIVTVTSIQTKYTDNLAHDDDIITLEDHGEWCGTNWCANDCLPNSCQPVYTIKMTFLELKSVATQSHPYYIPVPNSNINLYAIAHYGPIDNSAVKSVQRVSIQPSLKYEKPAIGQCNSCSRPTASALSLTVTVSGLTLTGVTYNLYRYNNLANVPTQDFNKNSANAISVTQVTSSMIKSDGTYVVTISASTSDEVIFRCVPSTAS